MLSPTALLSCTVLSPTAGVLPYPPAHTEFSLLHPVCCPQVHSWESCSQPELSPVLENLLHLQRFVYSSKPLRVSTLLYLYLAPRSCCKSSLNTSSTDSFLFPEFFAILMNTNRLPWLCFSSYEYTFNLFCFMT